MKRGDLVRISKGDVVHEISGVRHYEGAWLVPHWGATTLCGRTFYSTSSWSDASDASDGYRSCKSCERERQYQKDQGVLV